MFVLVLSVAMAVDFDGDGFHLDVDCNDGDAAVYPGAPEVCESWSQIDNDCDGNPNTYQGSYWQQPGDLPQGVLEHLALYVDADNDGFGDENATQPIYVCGVTQFEEFYAANTDDCDDGDDTKHPDAAEICNSIDDNCNTEIDEPTWRDVPGQTIAYLDADGDGYGDDHRAMGFCEYFIQTSQTGVAAVGSRRFRFSGADYSERPGDCNERDPSIHPQPPDFLESIDGADEDCDGAVLVHELDCDGDGAFLPGPVHLVDADMNGSVACGQLRLTVFASDALQPVVDWRQLELLFQDGYRLAEGDCPFGTDCEDSDPGRNSCRDDVCDGFDTDCSGADASADTDGDGIPDALQGGVPGLTTERLLDTDGDGVDDACDTLGPEVWVVGSGEDFPLPQEPMEEDDQPDASAEECGCAHAAPTGFALFVLPLLGLLQRRRG